MEPPDSPAPAPNASAAANDTAFRIAAVAPRPWTATIAPQLIGLFLWVVFYDRLPIHTLAVGGLPPAVAGLAAAGLLCFLLLYYAPAMWGCRTREPLVVTSQSTFGVVGAGWLTGLLFGLAHLVWLAVSVHFATELILQSFASCRLLDPRVVQPVAVGRYVVPSPLFLIVSALWCCWAGLVGAYLVRVIAALMRVYPVFSAAMLAAAMVWTIKGAADFRPVKADLATGQTIARPELMAFLDTLQLVFGFFAAAGLAAADWGAVSRDPRDVRTGGLVGVISAPWVTGTLALLVVAGARGAARTGVGPMTTTASVAAFTFHEVVYQDIGGWLGCAMLLILGLASLAPTTYASFVVGARLAAAWPRLSRVRWSVVGLVAGWLLIAARLPARLEVVFDVMGAVFGPMAGAMTADYVWHRGRWPGPRRGTSTAGLVAWVAGLSVGLAPTIARAWDIAALRGAQPAAVAGCVVAVVVYWILAALGGEAPRLAAPAAAPSVLPGEAADHGDVRQDHGQDDEQHDRAE